MRQTLSLVACLVVAWIGAGPVRAEETAHIRLSAIDHVWSSHHVPFGLAVSSDLIVVAYYDALRQITVAARPRKGGSWTYRKLDSWTNWDSHNELAVAVDRSGHIHVAGNMHNDPLVYFRSASPGDVRTLEKVATMVSPEVERRVTYPVYLHDPAGRLVFKYRDGGSGNGNEIYNVYDDAAQRWTHLLAAPLVDGEGKRNAYFVGPELGPDGWHHLTWVWRDTPDAATNHDLSYARSRDLVNWLRSDGSQLPLPITLAAAEVVDPVPVRGGMINNNTIIGFDQKGRVMIAYHKFDERGDTQIYLARREAKGWLVRQASAWRGFRWDFGGMGSLESRLTLRTPAPAGDNFIRVPVLRDGKAIELYLDAESLRRVEERPGERLEDRLATMIEVPSGMRLNLVADRGSSGIAIAWASRPPQRDLPSTDISDPVVLHLVEERP